jgi:hypothetical protein
MKLSAKSIRERFSIEESIKANLMNTTLVSYLTIDDGTSEISGRNATALAFRNLNKPEW